MQKIILSAVFSVLFTASFAQTKTEKIKTLLRVTNSANFGIQMASQFLDSYKLAYPNIPDEFWEEVKKEMKPEEINQMIIPVYDRHFTEKEIDDITAFYKTPSGSKMIQKMPAVFQESQAAGKEWGEKIASKVSEKIAGKYNYQSPPPAK